MTVAVTPPSVKKWAGVEDVVSSISSPPVLHNRFTFPDFVVSLRCYDTINAGQSCCCYWLCNKSVHWSSDQHKRAGRPPNWKRAESSRLLTISAQFRDIKRPFSSTMERGANYYWLKGAVCPRKPSRSLGIEDTVAGVWSWCVGEKKGDLASFSVDFMSF